MSNTANQEIIKILIRKRKHLFIILTITAILSYVFCSPPFIRPKFKSTAVVYPANIAPYSEESATEQLMQFLTSDEIRQALLKKFDLGTHYRLDPKDPKFQTYFSYVYEENFKITQTRFESIEIVVLDESPEMACRLANGIIEASNTLIKKTHEVKTTEFLTMQSSFLTNLTKEADSLKKILTREGDQHGMLDYFTQIKEVTKNYYKKGNANAALDTIIKNLEHFGPDFLRNMEHYKVTVLEIVKIEQEINALKRDLQKPFTYSNVVSKPQIPDTKAWPKRGFIVAISVISICILSCLFFIYIERFKTISHDIDTK